MPQLDPSSSKIARAPITVKPAGLIGTAELYLVSNATKVASSGEVSFTSTGGVQSISFPITMPAAEGTYKVYIDVFSAGELIGAFIAREDVVVTAPIVEPWQCPVCGARFATYSEIRAHLSAAHPAPGEQLGMNIRNITSTSVSLGAGATMGCYFVFWLEDGMARKVAQSGWVSAHVDFWRTVGGLTPGTEYLFAAFGVSGNKVVRGAMRFTTL